jgi:catechol 2,3-dioxygenase-like lactoylglutathione lyase family enzyme
MATLNAPTTYHAIGLSPILPVADLEKSLGFYSDVLGFETKFCADAYAILVHGGASLHLTRAESPSVLKAVQGHMSIYLEVDNIESLWAHVSQYKNRYRIRDLFDQEYGMREFHICDPDGCLIFVGEPIQAPSLPSTVA